MSRQIELSAVNQAMDSLQCGVMLLSTDTKIIWNNSVASEMFGYERGELVGQYIDILVPADIRQDHAQHCNSYIANPEKRQMGAGRDLSAIKKNGDKFYVEIGLNRIVIDDVGYICISVLDISVRKLIEHKNALLIKREKAIISDQLESFARITGSLSHEINNYLAAISGWAELVNASEADQPYIDNILNNCGKIAALLDELYRNSTQYKQG